MKFIILATILAVATAVPVPKSFGTGVRSYGQPYYYAYPETYSPLVANYPEQLVPVPGDFVVDRQPTSYTIPAMNTNPSGERFGNQQKIQLVLSVPSSVPAGTSLSVTVNVNSEPSGATVVSVSNPVVSTSPTGPSPVPEAPIDSVTVDAVNSPGSQPAGQLPDEFDLREPILFLPPFENSKDSPVLVAMQGEAQQQQLAALLKTKTA